MKVSIFIKAMEVFKELGIKSRKDMETYGCYPTQGTFLIHSNKLKKGVNVDYQVRNAIFEIVNSMPSATALIEDYELDLEFRF